MKYIKSLPFLIFSSILVSVILIYLANQEAWHYHLSVDIWGFYYPRFKYFIENHSFGGFQNNEYLPGAMLFFLIPGALMTTFRADSSEQYLFYLFLVNIFLIFAHLFIYRKHNHYSPLIFILILFCAGPIIIYRHDLYVSLFIILSLITWNIKKYKISPFLLGIATSIKVFPVVLFPYLLVISYKKGNLTKVLQTSAFFALGLGFVFFIYLLVGTPSEILDALRVNSIKPVHAESTWGTGLTVLNYIRSGFFARGLGANGIFGIDPAYILLPISFYNYFWLLPLGFFYYYIYKYSRSEKLNIGIAFLVILLFTIFSKILTPQYLFWFMPLLPLIYWGKKNVLMIVAIVTASIIVFTTQYIYPLHYSELLGGFFETGSSSYLFYILLARNILLLVLFVLVFIISFHGNHEETKK